MIEKSRLTETGTPAARRAEPDAVACPECGAEVEIGVALSQALRADLEAEFREKERLRARETKAAQQAVAREQAMLDARREALDAEVEKRVAVRSADERKAAEAAAEAKAQEAFGVQLEALRGQLIENRAALKEAQQKEIEFLKQTEALEKAREDIELTVARRMAEEHKRVRTETQAEADEAHKLAMAQRDEQIAGMTRKIEELRKKAEQGSQQTQGEALEVTLEDMLRAAFPQDELEPVPKGITGADLVHRVKSESGEVCGTILWEAKRTRHWSGKWLPKLRDDQRALKAELAALVSISVPDGTPPIANMEGVWVSGFTTAVGLAQVLRMSLRRSAAAKRALEGRRDKMDLLYAYFTGPEFRSRVEGLLEPFIAMKDDLEKEKRAVQRLWNKREKQIERAFTSTSGLYGDVQGIAGGAIPELGALQMPELDEGDDDTDAA